MVNCCYALFLRLFPAILLARSPLETPLRALALSVVLVGSVAMAATAATASAVFPAALLSPFGQAVGCCSTHRVLPQSKIIEGNNMVLMVVVVAIAVCYGSDKPVRY
jgi:hypothetical protein